MTHAEAPLDALVLDVGGVLVAHENHLIYEALAARCTAPAAREKVQAAIERAICQPHWDRGAAPIADLAEQLRHDLGYAGGHDDFLADWCCHFTVDEEMLELAATLAQRHRVVLFSNTNREHWTHLLGATGGRLGAFERFLSYEMGLSKPAIESFHFVARHAGIAPARSLFFDDRTDNVEGARRAGFQAEVFVDRRKFCDRLVEAGVAMA